MARLDQARLIESFDALRVDPVRFALGCYLLELFDRLAPDGGDRTDMRRLFAFALEALRAISTREPSARLRTLLELRALDALGLRPELPELRSLRGARRPGATGSISTLRTGARSAEPARRVSRGSCRSTWERCGLSSRGCGSTSTASIDWGWGARPSTRPSSS